MVNHLSIESAYPFKRHNNSLAYSDRCEDFVGIFQHYWVEEMWEEIGKDREGGTEKSDVELGRGMAEVLLKYCGQ